MSVFIGIELSDEAKKKIGGIEDSLRGRILSGTFVSEENHHITLQFLGDLQEERIAKLREAMDEASRHLRPFELKTGKVGEFMKRNRRIIWMGLEESKELQNAHNRLKSTLEEKGFETEKTAYVHHITLVRNAIWRNDESEATLQNPESVVSEVPILTDRFVLFESKRVEGRLCYIKKYESNFSLDKSINYVCIYTQ